MKIRTKELVFCSLFAALTAIFSQIIIPIGSVPINLATLSILICAGVLGAKYGTLSVLVYVVLGAAGVPVFASLKGGIAVLAGPTGGYILGYIVMAFISGYVFEKSSSWRLRAAAMITATAVCYSIGTVWFMLVMQAEWMAALATCVLPFLPGDIIKMIVACLVIQKLERYI